MGRSTRAPGRTKPRTLGGCIACPARRTAPTRRAALQGGSRIRRAIPLRGGDGAARNARAVAVRFQHLTVVRPAEARGTDWAEINLRRRIWEIPAARMKGGRHVHRVPLSDAAVSLLEETGPRKSGLVFPSTKGGLLAPSGWHKVIKRTGYDVTAHGIRSTFADWCREVAGVNRELRELSLAHQEKSDVVAAYARSDLLEQRRPVMQRWAEFLTGEENSDV